METDPEITLDKEWIEAFIRDLEQLQAAKKRRRENPYAAYLILVLWPRVNGWHRDHVIKQIRDLRQAKGLPMPVKFEETVQSAFQSHAGASKRFRGGPEGDLFYWPRGKGTGIWAVRQDRAAKWLKGHGLPEV